MTPLTFELLYACWDHAHSAPSLPRRVQRPPSKASSYAYIAAPRGRRHIDMLRPRSSFACHRTLSFSVIFSITFCRSALVLWLAWPFRDRTQPLRLLTHHRPHNSIHHHQNLTPQMPLMSPPNPHRRLHPRARRNRNIVPPWPPPRSRDTLRTRPIERVRAPIPHNVPTTFRDHRVRARALQ